jgi:hypothetical protein
MPLYVHVYLSSKRPVPGQEDVSLPDKTDAEWLGVITPADLISYIHNIGDRPWIVT